MTNLAEICDQIGRCAEGQLSVEALTNWLVDHAWEIDQHGTAPMQHLVRGAERVLGESSETSGVRLDLVTLLAAAGHST